jgi:hypothetical protein
VERLEPDGGGLELAEETLGLVVSTSMFSAESSWFGALRQFGRKAARAVQQGTRWMS